MAYPDDICDYTHLVEWVAMMNPGTDVSAWARAKRTATRDPERASELAAGICKRLEKKKHLSSMSEAIKLLACVNDAGPRLMDKRAREAERIIHLMRSKAHQDVQKRFDAWLHQGKEREE